MTDKAPVQYQTKPTIVEAMQVSLDNLSEVAKWCGGYVRGECVRFSIPRELKRVAADNNHYAIVGDYVVKTALGYVVIKPGKFESKHRRLNELIT